MYHKLLLLLLLLFFFPRNLWQAGNYPRSGGEKRNTHTRFSRVAVCFWNSDVDHKYLAKDRSQWSVIIQFWSIQAVNYEHHGRLFHFLGAFQKVARGINTPIKDCFWTACDSGLSLKYIETINYFALSKKGPLKVRTIGSISILLLIVGVYDFSLKNLCSNILLPCYRFPLFLQCSMYMFNHYLLNKFSVLSYNRLPIEMYCCCNPKTIQCTIVFKQDEAICSVVDTTEDIRLSVLLETKILLPTRLNYYCLIFCRL